MQPQGLLFLHELFGWEPRKLYDDIYNVLNNVAQSSVRSLVEFLEKTNDKTRNAYKSELEMGIVALKALMDDSVATNTDKSEVYGGRNIFYIPDDLIRWMRTPQQEGVDFTDPGRATQLEKELDEARNVLNVKHNQLRRRQVRLAELEAQRQYLANILERLPQFDDAQMERLERMFGEVETIKFADSAVRGDERGEFNAKVLAMCD